jgi:hypothetical protein
MFFTVDHCLKAFSALIRNEEEIAVAYFRAGYTPRDYPVH